MVDEGLIEFGFSKQVTFEFDLYCMIFEVVSEKLVIGSKTQINLVYL